MVGGMLFGVSNFFLVLVLLITISKNLVLLFRGWVLLAIAQN